MAKSALQALLRIELARAGDPKKTAAMQAYMKSAMPYYGVQTPAQRAITRRLFAAHRLETAAEGRTACLKIWREAKYREERYAAIELTGYKCYREWQTLALGYAATTVPQANAQENATVEPQSESVEAPQRHPVPALLQNRNGSRFALRRHRAVARIQRVLLAESHWLGATPVCLDRFP